LLELRALERIKLIADEDGDGHGALQMFVTVIASAAKQSTPAQAEEWIASRRSQ
jgi:hypothetical protein